MKSTQEKLSDFCFDIAKYLFTGVFITAIAKEFQGIYIISIFSIAFAGLFIFFGIWFNKKHK